MILHFSEVRLIEVGGEDVDLRNGIDRGLQKPPVVVCYSLRNLP